MAEASLEVGVVVRRSAVDNPWIDHVWSPHQVLSERPSAEPWTVLMQEEGATYFYAGSRILELFACETANYRDNFLSGSPQLWVCVRKTESGHELAQVTADPTEGEAYYESGVEIVGSVPMPADIASWVAAFVDEHHVEKAFIKRERDKSGPDPRKNRGGRPRDIPGSG